MRKKHQNGWMKAKRRRRSRLCDIADAAGVSMATVDRVVNDRGGVRPETAGRIYAAAQQLEYPRILPSRYLPRLRFDILTQESATPFHQALGRAFVQQGRAYHDHGVICHRHSFGAFEPQRVAAKIEELAEHSNGLAMSVVEHPTVRHAARMAIGRGTPVVTLANDLSEPLRLSYVGIDNRAAGRTAAYLMGRFLGDRPGKVAVFAGTLSYLGQEQRLMGFRSAIRERFPAIDVSEVVLSLDDAGTTYALTKAALAAGGLAAVYNVGAGNRGIAKALREAGRASDVTFIGHELTEYSRQFLLDGTMDAVIDQNPRGQAAQALEILLEYHGLADHDATRDLLPIDVVMPENLPLAAVEDAHGVVRGRRI